MAVDPRVLVTILLMGAVIYATRAGGLWLASRVEISGRLEAWLGFLPGAILVSIVAPTVLTSGRPKPWRLWPSCWSPSGAAACSSPR